MIATSLASLSRPLWRLLERYRLRPELVFREAGLDPAAMEQPRGRYDTGLVVAAWVNAAEAIDNPNFGLEAAETVRLTDLHALGYAFLASGTLYSALGRVARYHAVVNDAARFELVEAGEGVELTVAADIPGLLHTAPIEDARWAVVTCLCRMSYGDRLNPVEVSFRHAEPVETGAHFGFFRCPVRFGAARSAIVFARTDLERPLSSANRELARANDRILAELLVRLRDDRLVSRVKEAIIEELPSGSPSDEVIARAVHLSPRTLQRRLAAEGTSYSQILDAVRRELAEGYVADPARTLGEISYLLGFSEPSAFSRAFKRWTGAPPTIYRERAA
jgi:AraC-like DNA-binding protein